MEANIGNTDKCDKVRNNPTPDNIKEESKTQLVPLSQEIDTKTNNPKLLEETSLKKVIEVKLTPQELRRRLQNEIDLDERYQLINEAKLRALTSGTKSYEEFRQIWMAAHLKPMEKQDKLDAFLRGPGSKVLWNSVADAKNGTNIQQGSAAYGGQYLDLDKRGQVFQVDKSSPTAFTKTWRSLQSPVDKFSLLKYFLKPDEDSDPTGGSIPQPLPLEVIWKEEVPSDLFSDVVKVLLTIFDLKSKSTEKVEVGFSDKMLKILEICGKSRRFGITMTFMRKSEQDRVNTLLGLIEEEFQIKCEQSQTNEEKSKRAELLKTLKGKFFRGKNLYRNM